MVTVESCTGGLVAAALTDVPGSSDVFDRAYVTYSNTAKRQMVGVPKKLLEQHGAVSEAVARAMAEGGLAKAKVEVSVAITGVAGPGGGSAEKPVGLVHVACAAKGRPTVARRHLWHLAEPGADRSRIRALSARSALQLVRVTLDQEPTEAERP